MGIIDKLISREAESEELKRILNSLITSRVFSEEFILKYFDYLSVEDIRVLHKPQICSGEYEKLTLLIKASESL